MVALVLHLGDPVLRQEPEQLAHARLTRLRETVSEFLDVEDGGTLDVLLDRGAPEGSLWRPDAFLLSATTVFTGARSAR